MNVLIAVASRHGSTREIAAVMAEELRACGLFTDVRDADEVASFDGYDAVILGSAVYFGSWLPQARKLVGRCQSEFAARPVWLFSSGPLGSDDPKPLGEPAEVVDLMAQSHAREHLVLVGKLDSSSLSLTERIVVAMVGAQKGDFRDWNAIRDWVRRIATSLGAECAPSGTPAVTRQM